MNRIQVLAVLVGHLVVGAALAQLAPVPSWLVPGPDWCQSPPRDLWGYQETISVIRLLGAPSRGVVILEGPFVDVVVDAKPLEADLVSDAKSSTSTSSARDIRDLLALIHASADRAGRIRISGVGATLPPAFDRLIWVISTYLERGQAAVIERRTRRRLRQIRLANWRWHWAPLQGGGGSTFLDNSGYAILSGETFSE